MKRRSITIEDIDHIVSMSKMEATKLGQKTTVVCLTLPNGFEMVQSSACVEPTNYNHDIGVDICLKRIRERIWELEGYVLQTDLAKSGEQDC